MSSKHLKRLQSQSDHPNEPGSSDEAESSEEDLPITKGRNQTSNLFATLDVSDSEEEEEEIPPAPVEKEEPVKAKQGSGKKNNKNNRNNKNKGGGGGGGGGGNNGGGKGGKGGKKGKKGKKGKGGSMNDDEWLEAEVAASVAAGELPSEAAEGLLDEGEGSLLGVNLRLLSGEAELRRMFGSKTVSAVVADEGGRRGQVGAGGRGWAGVGTKPVQRGGGGGRGAAAIAALRSKLVRTRPYWIRPDDGLRMEHVKTVGGVHHFSYSWSAAYAAAQAEFLSVVASADPNQIAALVEKSPSHADAIVQLAEACRTMGQHEAAEELLERAIYILEAGAHPMWKLAPDCRLDYEAPENRVWFLAVFRYTMMLARKGCFRTALEWSKVLLCADPTDPMCVLLTLDHYALRSGQYEYLARLYFDWQHQSLATLPNMAYSAAMAAALRAEEAGVGPSGELDGVPSDRGADALLDHALAMFPSMIAALSEKMSFSAGTGWTELLADPWWSSEWDGAFGTDRLGEEESTTLGKLVTLTIERNAELWKPPVLQEWLLRGLQRAMAIVSEVRENPESEQGKRLKEAAMMRSMAYVPATSALYQHVLLAGLSNSETLLPEDVVAAGPEPFLFGGMGDEEELGNQPLQRGQPGWDGIGVDNEADMNALQLFLQTLMPWTAGRGGADGQGGGGAGGAGGAGGGMDGGAGGEVH